MNIYEIGQNYASLLYEIEQANGEVTEEQEAMLSNLDYLGREKIDAYIAVRAEMKMAAEATRNEARRLQDLARVRENAVKRLEDRVLGFLQTTGQRRLEGTLGSVSVVKSGTGKVVIDNENEFLEKYADTEFVAMNPMISKTKIKNYIKQVGELDGARIEEAHEGLRWA